METEKQYLDVNELSRYLRIKPSTLYAWAAQGKIPCVKVHRLIRFRRDEIDCWVESFRQHPTPKAGLQIKAIVPDLETTIARAKGQAYNPSPRGNQTKSSLIGKEGMDGAV
ncbi:MAG: helix-turn-helix domain-containing protein [Terriglobia bacterium]